MRYERLRNRAVGIFTAAALLSAGGAAMAADGVVRNHQPVWAADVYGGWVSTYVVVRVEPGMKAAFDAIAAKQGAKTGNRIVDAELAKWNVTAITPLFDIPFGRPDVAAKVGLDRYYKILVPAGTDTPHMAKAVEALKFFENVQNDTIGGVADTIPNDTEFAKQWALRNTGQNTPCGGTGTNDADVDASDAWDSFTGEDNVTLAVIDSGVFDHVDFEHHVDFGRAWNTVNNNTNVSDDCQHGTHCTGIAAAVGNNGQGVAGVSWGTIVIPVKVLTGCSGNTTDCAEGVLWATDHGCNVQTMSLRYFDGLQAFQDAITYSWELGVEVIAAAGNDFPDTPKWPASFEHVLAIGATDIRDNIAGFSSQGAVVDMSAPGVDIWSTMVNNTFACYSGTSMATPTVAGAACLLWSYAPTATNEEIEAALIAGSEDKGVPGWDKAFGWGRLNVNNSLQLVNPGVSIKVPVAPGNLQSPGAIVSFDVTVKQGKDQYVPNSQLLHYRFDGGSYQTLPLVYKTGDTWTATLPAVACGDQPEFYVSVEGVNTGVKTWPKNAPADVLEFAVGDLQDTPTIIEVTGFNNGLPQGWSANGFWHVSSACSVGDSCDGGTFAYFGKDANCKYNNGGVKAVGSLGTTITLPDIAAVGNLQLVYCYTLQTENKPGLDTAKVYINGVQVDQATESANAWNTRTVDITAFEGQTVDLAFTFDSKDEFYNGFRGWQVDGVKFAVTDVVCATCYGDYNADGELDLFDFLAYVNSFNAGEPKSDCDGNGVRDFFDFLCFQNAFVKGC